MQPVKENNEHSRQRYICSNPNCKKVFSRPKIIKYYVCPSCQTLVEMTVENAPQVPLEEDRTIEKEATREERKIAEQVGFQPQVIGQHPVVATEGLIPLAEKELTGQKDQDQKEPVVEEPHSKEQTAPNEPMPSSSSSDCKYSFGYLHHRAKGAEIPETCISCPRSLDCLLSEHYKSEETVSEIKKWYH